MASDGTTNEVEADGPSWKDVSKSSSEDIQEVLGEMLLNGNMQREAAKPFGSQTQDKVSVTHVSQQGVMDDMSDINLHLKKLCEHLKNIINSYTAVVPIFRDTLERQHWLTDHHLGSASVDSFHGDLTEEAKEEMRQNMYLEILDMMERIKWISSAMETIKAPESQQEKSKSTKAENEDHCEMVKINSVTASVRDLADIIMRQDEDEEEEEEKKKTDQYHQSSIIENVMEEEDGGEDRRVTCSREASEEIYKRYKSQEVKRTVCDRPSVVTSHGKGSVTKMNEQSTNHLLVHERKLQAHPHKNKDQQSPEMSQNKPTEERGSWMHAEVLQSRSKDTRAWRASEGCTNIAATLARQKTLSEPTIPSNSSVMELRGKKILPISIPVKQKSEKDARSKVSDTQRNSVSGSKTRDEGEDESEKGTYIFVKREKQGENELDMEAEFKVEVEKQTEDKSECEHEETSECKDDDEGGIKSEREEVKFHNDEDLDELVRFKRELEVNVNALIDGENGQKDEKEQDECKVASERKNEAEPGEEFRDDGQERIEDESEGEVDGEEDGEFESEREDKIMDEAEEGGSDAQDYMVCAVKAKVNTEDEDQSERVEKEEEEEIETGGKIQDEVIETGGEIQDEVIETGGEIQDEVIEDLKNNNEEEGRDETEDEIENVCKIQDEVKKDLENKGENKVRAEEINGMKSEVESKIEDEVIEDLNNKSDDEPDFEVEPKITSEAESKFQDDVKEYLKEKCGTETEAKDVSAVESEAQKVNGNIEMNGEVDGEADEEREIKSEYADKIQDEVNEELEDKLEVGSEVDINLKVEVEVSDEVEIVDEARQVVNTAAERKLSFNGHNVQGENFGENKDEEECKVKDNLEVKGEVISEAEDETEVEGEMKDQKGDSNHVEGDVDSEAILNNEIEQKIELSDKEKCEDESEAGVEIKDQGEEEGNDISDFKGKVDSESEINDDGKVEVEIDIKSEGEGEFKVESEAKVEAHGEASVEQKGEGEDKGNKELDRNAWSNDKNSERCREVSWSETKSESLSENKEKDKVMEGDIKGERESSKISTQQRESKDAGVLERTPRESLAETSTRTRYEIESDLSRSWMESLGEMLAHKTEDVDTDVSEGFPKQRFMESIVSSELSGYIYTAASQCSQTESPDKTLTHLSDYTSTDELQNSTRKSETSFHQRESIVDALRHRIEHEDTETSQQFPRQSLGETCVLEAQMDNKTLILPQLLVHDSTEASSSPSSLRRQSESQVFKEIATGTLTSPPEEAAHKLDYTMLHTSSMSPGYSSQEQIDPQFYQHYRQQRYGDKLPNVNDGKVKHATSRARISSPRSSLDDLTLPYVKEIRTLVRKLGYSHQFLFALTGSRVHRHTPKSKLRVGHLYKQPSQPRNWEDPTSSKFADNHLERTLLLLQHNRLPLASQDPHDPPLTSTRKQPPTKMTTRGTLPPLRQKKYLVQQGVDPCECWQSTDERSHLANQCRHCNPEHLEISCDDFVQSILMYQIPEVRRLQDNFLFLYNHAPSRNITNPHQYQKAKSKRRTFPPKLPPSKN